MSKIKFRCSAKTENAFRTITVDTQLKVAACDCEAFSGYFLNFCSHIDSTLLAGERYMVPEEDRAIADQAMSIMAGQLSAPNNWKASWRAKNVWRGLSSPRGPRQKREMKDQFGENYYLRPKVCFTGKGAVSRKIILQSARDSGWQAVDTFQAGIKVLVAEDPTNTTRKLNQARKFATPILSYEEWGCLNAQDATDEDAVSNIIPSDTTNRNTELVIKNQTTESIGKSKSGLPLLKISVSALIFIIIIMLVK